MGEILYRGTELGFCGRGLGPGLVNQVLQLGVGDCKMGGAGENFEGCDVERGEEGGVRVAEKAEVETECG